MSNPTGDALAAFARAFATPNDDESCTPDANDAGRAVALMKQLVRRHLETTLAKAQNNA